MRFDTDTAWFPLSAGQQSRWFLYQFDPANRGNHNIVFVAALTGCVDQSAVSLALTRLAARHPMLRVQFRSGDDGEPQQRVADGVSVALSVLDATRDDAELLRSRVSAEAWRAFDPSGGALVRAQLFVRGLHDAVLLIAFDHLICDGWSYWQLIEEFGILMATPHADDAPRVDDVSSYRAYVAWQRDWLATASAQKQLGYWRERLGGTLPVLSLPLDRPRPAQASGVQGVVSLHLPPMLTERINALASRQAGTMYTALLAGFQILLHRYSGQSEIVVGSPMLGRSRAEWSRVVGDFVNIVALRADFGDDATVTDVFRNARGSVMRAMRNQDYPFSRLVDELQPGQGHGEHPFFQASFVFQKARHGNALSELWNVGKCGAKVAHWGATDVSPFPIQQMVANDRITLALHAIELSDHVRCDFTYDADVFDAATVARMAANFETLLQGIAEGIDKVDQLPLLSVMEYAEVTQKFNATALAYRLDACLHQLFEEQVKLSPDSVALVHRAAALSYLELNRRANRVAHRLHVMGVKPDDCVAVCLDRGIDMVVGILGILKAGGAYVPVDPGYPADRRAYMLADCAPVAVLTLSSSVADIDPAVPALALDDATLAHAPMHDLDRMELGLTARHLAYVIYTSGSTGLPKGVAIEHANAVNLMAWSVEHFSVDELRNTQFSTSINFDLSIYELFVPLCHGHVVTLVRDVLDSAQTGITLINTVPTGIGALVDTGHVAKSVKLINLAGEPLKRRLVERIFAATQVDAIANLYGPTETTTYSTWVRFDRGQPFAEHIGRPLANTQIYVVDRYLRPVPIGAIGEIVIGGAGVARGYLNRPELTAERFVADPFSDVAGARMYKTGDLGRWLPDGTIEYLGRNDFQVKIRGFRIELGEIEARLLSCTGVREAVVVAGDDAAGGKRLIAYMVAEAGAECSAAHLRAALSRDLAECMIPSAFVRVDALPLTPNGKLDRRALPVPDQTAVAQRSYEAPVGTFEQTLAAIWQELLGVAQIGRNDHFFQSGGNSLLALRVVSRIRTELSVEVPLRALFAQPTLAVFADVVARAQATVLTPIAPADRSLPIPLSWSQQRLWFIDQMDRNASAAYHMPAAICMRGTLDLPALRQTLDRIVDRHENLRTTFVDAQGNPAQSIAPMGIGFHIVEHDLRHLDADVRHEAVAELCIVESAQRFDLATGPLIRGRLLRTASDEHTLLVTQHHIISDGWSIRVLMREFSTLYAAFHQRHADPLPALSIQYADYAVWQRRHLRDGALQAQVDYWRRHLGGAPALLTLPTDRPRPARQSHAGGSVPIQLPSALLARLDTLARRHDATLFMALMAAWSILLSRLSGQDDIVVGTPVANRQRAEIEPLIGFFVNTLALRVRIADASSVSSLVAQIRAAALDAYAHQDLPFEQVVEALQPVRTLSHSPLFQVMLTLDTMADDDVLHLPGLQITTVARPRTTTQYDLSLSLTEQAGTLSGSIEYASDLFDHSTVERFAGYFSAVVEAIVSDDTQSIALLPMMPATERHQLLETFNATQSHFPHDQLIHELFEAQAVAQPEADAVMFEDQVLSYGALNQRANQVAHRLIALGVKPDDRVALCVERSVAMVVGLLGILKAGAGYVPLDPAYPADRLAYMLDDSAPIAVLTQSLLRTRLPLLEASVLPVVVLDDGSISTLPSHNPQVSGLAPEHLAYVIYTSGSTGQPKGVMVPHRGVVNYLTYASTAYLRADMHGALVATPLSFDATVTTLLVPWLTGKPVVLMPEDSQACLTQLLAYCRSPKPWLFKLTPSHLDALSTLMEVRASATRHLLVVGGEQLTRRCLDRFRARVLPGSVVVNEYGPTEAVVGCTTYFSESSERSASDAMPIGRPIANMRIYLLDTQRQPVPVGVTGELYIGGVGVTRGYLNRAELTAERFLADPFSKDAGARLYKTGDLGRWLPDGTIEYLGRNDFQVKIRGFRIELGEIEARLCSCVGVREAVVIAREEASGDKRLVAYIVPDEGTEFVVSDLRSALSQGLAEYMIPSAFVCIDALPLTPNGKLDRKALPAPDQSSLASRVYAAPIGDVEQTIAAIWQSLLGVERVGRNDHFFELGGHSLLAAQLIARLRQTFAIEMSIVDLFSTPQVAPLARSVLMASMERYASSDVERLGADIDQLSKEELLALLEEES